MKNATTNTNTNTNKELKSVVYSFEARWDPMIREGDLRVFFRKRRPIKMPHKVYFYVGVPTMSIIGFSKVEHIDSISLEQALSYTEQGQISPDELIKYIGQEGYVNAIWIEQPRMFKKSISLKSLKDSFNFNPPQSFSYVNSPLCIALNDLCP